MYLFNIFGLFVVTLVSHQVASVNTSTDDAERDNIVITVSHYDMDKQEWINVGSTTTKEYKTVEIPIYLPPDQIVSHIKKRHVRKGREPIPYRLKVGIKTRDQEEKTFFSALVPQDIIESDINYSLIVLLDNDLIPIGTNARVFKFPPPASVGSHSVNVFFKHMENAPQPDTATFIHKLEKEREAKERGTNQDNRSFLSKYWMYIVPFLIFAVLSGSVNSDQVANGR